MPSIQRTIQSAVAKEASSQMPFLRYQVRLAASSNVLFQPVMRAERWDNIDNAVSNPRVCCRVVVIQVEEEEEEESTITPTTTTTRKKKIKKKTDNNNNKNNNNEKNKKYERCQ